MKLADSLEAKTTKAAWLAFALLVVSVAINYIDRTNLSVAAPGLRTELRLSPAHLGLLFSAFFWTYASFQIVSGWLVD
ncbi:MAG: MFS transporter, partial [Bryobacteraceae bacterium]